MRSAAPCRAPRPGSGSRRRRAWPRARPSGARPPPAAAPWPGSRGGLRVDLRADLVAADRGGVHAHAPAPRLEPVGARARSRMRAARGRGRTTSACAARPARAPLPAMRPGCRTASRRRRGAGGGSPEGPRSRAPRGSAAARAAPAGRRGEQAGAMDHAGSMNAAGAIGAITVPSGARRGRTRIGLVRRTASATLPSASSAAVGEHRGVSAAPASARLWKVPPEIPSEGSRHPGKASTLKRTSALPGPRRGARARSPRRGARAGRAAAPRTRRPARP